MALRCGEAVVEGLLLCRNITAPGHASGFIEFKNDIGPSSAEVDYESQMWGFESVFKVATFKLLDFR